MFLKKNPSQLGGGSEGYHLCQVNLVALLMQAKSGSHNMVAQVAGVELGGTRECENTKTCTSPHIGWCPSGDASFFGLGKDVISFSCS